MNCTRLISRWFNRSISDVVDLAKMLFPMRIVVSTEKDAPFVVWPVLWASVHLFVIPLTSNVVANADAPGSTAVASEATVVPVTTADRVSFYQAWEIVRDSHWDPDLGGVDWEAAKEELSPQVEAATSRDEVRLLIRELLGRLGQSHFGLVPKEAYNDGENDPSGDAKKRGEAGINARLRDGQLVVTKVKAGSGADEVGIRPGWIIRRIGSRTHDDMIASAKTRDGHGPMRLDTIVGFLCDRWLSGAPGTEISLELLDLTGFTHELTVPIHAGDGEWARFGNLPPMRLSIEKEHLPEDVLYFSFSVFIDPSRLLPQFHRAVSESRSTRGLIIDLRGNRGGIGVLTFAMASAFADQSGKLGVMQMRGQAIQFPVFEAPEPYREPVAVLIDECTVSSAEILAAGLQDLGLARTFGSRTAGLVLPSKIVELPNGDALQCAVASYTTNSGRNLEGEGVSPDEVVAEAPQDFRVSEDPVLKAAVTWVLEQ